MAQHPAGIEPMTSRVLLHRCVLNHCTTIASQCFSGKNSDDFGIHNQVFRMKPLRNVYNATSTTKNKTRLNLAVEEKPLSSPSDELVDSGLGIDDRDPASSVSPLTASASSAWT